MRLHCLGTAGYHPNAARQTSCYFLPDCGIVLDAGSGMFRLAPLLKTKTLDILLSHAHLDHVIGLTFLLETLHQHPLERLRIWGEAEKLNAVRTHLFNDLLFPISLPAEWMAIDDQSEMQIGDARVSWRPQPHPGGSVAYRLDWPSEPGVPQAALASGVANAFEAADVPGKCLVYATDTSGDGVSSFSQWASGADLLMHECYFNDAAQSWAEKTGHTWSSRLVEIAAAAKPEQLLVTHLHPQETPANRLDLDSIHHRTGGSVMLAQDGLEIEF